MGLHVTQHALDRFKERVADLPDETIRTILTAPVFHVAADFGAEWVRLATGQRVAVRDHCIVTVLPAENYRRNVRRQGKGRFG